MLIITKYSEVRVQARLKIFFKTGASSEATYVFAARL